MNFKELHEKGSAFAQSIKANASVSYGPFVAGNASYSNSVSDKKFSSTLAEDGLEVSGMQLIALKCALLPKAPNPDPKIEQWS